MGLSKVNWDVYYLTQCFVLAQRSIDQSTKCGAIIVSKDNRVLSQGYNGPLRNSLDGDFPTERPYKYFLTLHAEENAILSYNGSYRDIQGSTIYITGSPCHKCLRMCLQKGIRRFVYPKFPITKCQDEMDLRATEDMLGRLNENVEILELDITEEITKLLKKTRKYINEKVKG